MTEISFYLHCIFRLYFFVFYYNDGQLEKKSFIYA